MIIDCISDLHGYKPKLAGGDLLIIAGDHTARDTLLEFETFKEWLGLLPYRCKIIIGGNHDTLLEKGEVDLTAPNIHYLCDSGIEFEGLKIWGSPYTRRFTGQNPACMAFALHTEFQLRDHFDLIPQIPTSLSPTPRPTTYSTNARMDAWAAKCFTKRYFDPIPNYAALAIFMKTEGK